MLKSNLLDGGSTNIRLSSSAYDVLVEDCLRFGFIKNDKANITYIISKLAKELTEYRNDLHNKLLLNNENNLKIVKNIEKNIFNIYQKTLNYICDDTYINVGYRVSKEFISDIKYIFYEILEKFDMDFASYLRSIIYEYCSRSNSQRELFLNYSLVKNINKSIKREHLASVVNDGIQNKMVFVSIEQTKDGFNYLLGLTEDKKTCLFLPLCKTETIVLLKEKMHVEQNDYDKIAEKFYEFLEANY